MYWLRQLAHQCPPRRPSPLSPANATVVPPASACRHGLHEDLFTHFLQQLEASCDVVPLNAEQDYRRLGRQPLQPVQPLASGDQPHTSSSSIGSSSGGYFYPLGSAAEAALEHQWRQVAGSSSNGSIDSSAPAPHAAPEAATAAGCSSSDGSGGTELEVMFGRRLRVERSAGGAAWFRFSELCARPLGAADYMALSQAYHTVFLEGVPALSMQASFTATVALQPLPPPPPRNGTAAAILPLPCCRLRVPGQSSMLLAITNRCPSSPTCLLSCRCVTRRGASSLWLMSFTTTEPAWCAPPPRPRTSCLPGPTTKSQSLTWSRCRWAGGERAG